MKHKHTIFLILIGWLIGAFLPPSKVLGMVSSKTGV